MNEQLQNALAAILDKTINGIDASVQFMAAELPDVINQLLLWYATKGILMLIIGILCAIAPFIIYKKLKERIKSRDDAGEYTDELFELYMPWFLSLIMFWLGAILMINIEWLQILIAPKIWLIEYAASIAK